MSKRPAAKPGPQPPAKTSKERVKPVEEPARPLKPQPKLFTMLLIAFVIWLGALLTLYFGKVFPLRHPSSAPAAAKS